MFVSSSLNSGESRFFFNFLDSGVEFLEEEEEEEEEDEEDEPFNFRLDIVINRQGQKRNGIHFCKWHS